MGENLGKAALLRGGQGCERGLGVAAPGGEEDLRAPGAGASEAAEGAAGPQGGPAAADGARLHWRTSALPQHGES